MNIVNDVKTEIRSTRSSGPANHPVGSLGTKKSEISFFEKLKCRIFLKRY